MTRERVFVSSTFEDLREYRARVCARLRELGCEPVAMEEFGSRGAPPAAVCAEEVLGSDALVGIYAWRYGSRSDPDGPSITEQEYDLARANGKLCLCYMVDRSVAWPPAMQDGGDDAEKLVALKRRISADVTWRSFTTPDDLAGSVAVDVGRELLGLGAGVHEEAGGNRQAGVPKAGASSVALPLAFRPMPDDWMSDPIRPELPHYAAGPGPSHPTLVWVPAGTYTMGSEPFEHDEAPTPLREVEFARGFWMQECPVTNAQYAGFLNDRVRSGDGVAGLSVLASQDVDITKDAAGEYCVRGGREDYPVVGVDWHGARVYAQRYWMRLPAEEEWEYAARGPEDRIYPWGDEWDPERCCCPSNPGPQWLPGPNGRYLDGQDPGTTGWAAAYAQGPKATVQTVPVPPDARGRWFGGESWCGAVDMAGNVLEWCEDTWIDADGRVQSGNRVVRGGNYANYDSDCKTFCRRHHPASTYARSSVGFRCVVDWAAVERLRSAS